MAESSKLLYAELSSYNYPKLYFRLGEGLKSVTTATENCPFSHSIASLYCGLVSQHTNKTKKFKYKN